MAIRIRTLVLAVNLAGIAGAQQAAPASTADVLKTIDQLVEQNKQLEKQNQQLLDQINALRQSLTAPTAPPTQKAVSAQALAATTAATQASSASTQNEPSKVSAADENASDGNAAIFGEFNPGKGFTVGRNEHGELNLSGYMAVRFLDQLPPDQTATDHLGRPYTVTPRKDFQFHRVMLFSQGWLFSPKFRYNTFLWTVQDTNQVAVGGALTYSFNKYVTIGGGWNAYPGTMSLQGSHPYWLTYDRVMADEFFRPFFSQGVFGQGIIMPRLEYRWMFGNNNSNLDVPATRLDRNLSFGGALTWQPTTGEFGPRGAFGDYERHEKLATRFNLAYTYSPEDRQTPLATPQSSNTTIRLGDSLNIFDTGTFANGLTVTKAIYRLWTASAGMKKKGFWLQGEGYYRRLSQFEADGPMPVKAVNDTGFYVQASQMIVPNRIEFYGGTSYIFSNYGKPKEFIAGANYYPWNTRNLRMNLHVINVGHSPVSSTFGFYNGQISGHVVAVGFTAMY